MSLSLMTPVDEFICVLNTALVGRVRTRAGRSHTSEASQDASGAETQNCAVWLGYFIQLENLMEKVKWCIHRATIILAGWA